MSYSFAKDDIKQFKDPVYGYIPVPSSYVKKLIDTQKMQRIKGVAQTGLRPVFSSATHDRFSHSLGVYKFGLAMFDSLAKKVIAWINTNGNRQGTPYRTMFNGMGNTAYIHQVENQLNHWRNLLSIACLLHDIGHPVQSHGFEFLYDDCYLDASFCDNPIIIGDGMPSEEVTRIYERYTDAIPKSNTSLGGMLTKCLINAIAETHSGEILSAQNSLPGNPHERMSAYFILKDKTISANVKELIEESKKDNKELFSTHMDTGADLCFIVRMIIGWEYPVSEQLTYDEDNFLKSIKNCIIHILNGTIDADGIDYLMRNSYNAGYDTSKIDSTRLCNAYTVFERNGCLFPAFSKSALSVLEGYIAARNFEPKWLYSHHKVVYADVLTKQIFKYATKYMCDKTMLGWSIHKFFSLAEKAAVRMQEGEQQNLGKELLLNSSTPGQQQIPLTVKQLRTHMAQWSFPFYTYLLAPCHEYNIGGHHFSQTDDADLNALFHWLQNEVSKQDYDKFKGSLLQNVSWEKLSTDLGEGSALVSLRTLLLEEKTGELLHKIEYNEDLKGKYIELKNIFDKWIFDGDSSAAIQAVQEIKGLIDDIKDLVPFFNYTKDQKPDILFSEWVGHYLPLLSKAEYEHLQQLLAEFETRQYRGSLWKSYPEYSLFLSDCAKELGISNSDVARYMTLLIVNGMVEHGFSIYDGAVIKNVPMEYREQFFYTPDEEPSKIVKLFKMRPAWKTLKAIAGFWATKIFTRNEVYDFSGKNIVAKFYTQKIKDFSKINLLFGDRVVPLNRVFPKSSAGKIQYPYFYYHADKSINMNDPKLILDKFKSLFIDYCRVARQCEVRSDSGKMGKTHVFRDAVHGDIEIPEPFYAVICTREFQRLGRIKQLATADRSFPHATHTRLSHSLGTWHVMKKILDHFKAQYSILDLPLFDEEERDAALLAALLHDIGHGPYSHAFEVVSGVRHEDISLQIIKNSNTEVNKVIKSRFGERVYGCLCELLEDSTGEHENNRIYQIYRSLVSSQLDADRIDYLMRDNASCGMSYGHIDIQQLISSMQFLPSYSDDEEKTEYKLCFDDRYFSAIDQFVYARYQMYKNVYHDPQKLLYEKIFEKMFALAFDLLGAIKNHEIFDMVYRLYRTNSVDIDEYLRLDDEAINSVIKQWAEGDVVAETVTDEDVVAKGNLITLLAQAFINHKHLFDYVDLGDNPLSYSTIEKRLEQYLEKQLSDKSYLGNSCAFITIKGSNYAYKRKENEKENILLRNAEDGTTYDYSLRSLFRGSNQVVENQDSVLLTDFIHFFYSKSVLLEELTHKLKGECTLSAETEEKRITSLVDSARLRSQIEIERKFYCSEDVLISVENWLKNDSDITNRFHQEKEESEQIDKYYDIKTIDGTLALYSAGYSFRCRKKNGHNVFTLKVPTSSSNYKTETQFARYEYTFMAESDCITEDVCAFLMNTLQMCKKKPPISVIKPDHLIEILIVKNQRTLVRLMDNDFQNCGCEICLDRVTYFDSNDLEKPIGAMQFQMEIELLSKPEYWITLNRIVIQRIIAHVGRENLIDTSYSKLEKGMNLLRPIGSEKMDRT